MVPVPPPPVQPEAATNSGMHSLCPLSSGQCLASYNWGGYAVCVPQADCAALTGAPGTVTDVVGSWVVPAIVGNGHQDNSGRGDPQGQGCSDNENTWYDDADWVGIDGFVSGTVEQTGTSSDCYYGQAYYYAWYEFYPAPSILISSITVHPGDTITAEVTNAGGMFTTTLTDQRTHQSFTSPATAVPGALTDSAEWISESAYFDGFLALTQTQPVQFFDAQATIGGVTQGISAWGSDVFYLLMVDYNFGLNQETGVATPATETLQYAKANTSPLGRSGDSFTVYWLSGGP
jgi:hypothetical protein